MTFRPFLIGCRMAAAVAVVAQLSACSALSVRTEPLVSTRNLVSGGSTAAPTRQDSPKPSSARIAEEGLRLARVLRDQQRFDSASEVYAQLERRGLLDPLQMLEFSTVADRSLPPEESLALYGRTRRAIDAASLRLEPPAIATLCNGLGRARLALGQHDAAMADFDCALAAEPDNTVAMNAKGVLLDTRGQHTQARDLFARASEREPANFRVLNNLALSHLVDGNADKAVALLSGVRAPQWPTLKLNLAFAHVMRGDDGLARRTLDELMPPQRAHQALVDLVDIRDRVRTGARLTDELMAASHRILLVQAPGNHD